MCYDNRYRGQGGSTGGETTTDAFGKFNIDFIANANQRFPKEDRPIYNSIDADVTDSTVKTHGNPHNQRVITHES
jgi:hypothetical protein